MGDEKEFRSCQNDFSAAWVERRCCDKSETVFNVRIGPDYTRNRRKAPSGEPLYECVGVDLFRCEEKPEHLSKYIRLPDVPANRLKNINGIPPFLVAATLLPDYDPPNPLWGATRTEGPGFCYVVYFLIKEEVLAELEDLASARPQCRLYKEFLEDTERLGNRFKGMASLKNIDDVKMGFALRRLLLDYNEKPILTRPQHQFFTDNQTYFEIDIDVHQFNFMGRKGLQMMRPLLEEMVWDVGVTIEAHTNEELPETILGVTHLHGLNLKNCDTVDFSNLPTVTQEKAEMVHKGVGLDTQTSVEVAIDPSTIIEPPAPVEVSSEPSTPVVPTSDYYWNNTAAASAPCTPVGPAPASRDPLGNHLGSAPEEPDHIIDLDTVVEEAANESLVSAMGYLNPADTTTTDDSDDDDLEFQDALEDGY